MMPHLISQSKLNHLVRDMNLSKDQARLLHYKTVKADPSSRRYQGNFDIWGAHSGEYCLQKCPPCSLAEVCQCFGGMYCQVTRLNHMDIALSRSLRCLVSLLSAHTVYIHTIFVHLTPLWPSRWEQYVPQHCQTALWYIPEDGFFKLIVV